MRMMVDVSAPSAGSDEVVLEVDGRQISGWNAVELTLRAEGFPNSFAIALSARGPAGKSLTIVKAGDPCQVRLGGDVAITGYIDRYSEGGDANGHSLSIQGRGMTQDLVDCSAEWPTDQLIQGNAFDIATKLAEPYGIAVVLGSGANAGDPVPAWCLNYSEPAAEIVQRVAQNAHLLAYEDAWGRLVLGTVGKVQAASGIAYGKNVQAWGVETSMDERYSDVVCCAMAMNAWGDLPGSDFFDTEHDPNVPRHRRLNIIMADVADDPQKFTIGKAIWEVARRAGRACIVRATIDSWRDKAGTLWTPNTLIPVDVPGLNIADKNLVLSEVTFLRDDEGGTRAQMTLMPPAAFTPEPISLLPIAAADILGPDSPQ